MKKTLRSELTAQNPTLYSALERSTEIAKTQWLPSVPESKHGSYNSYPHILGIEYHLDDILFRDDAPSQIIKLNPTEIYVLLCSVLFHDIGKAKKSKEEQDVDIHALHSRDIINEYWAELGIISERLARIIGNICYFHKCSNDTADKDLKIIYNIDRYEPIRGRNLGALLMLADNVDDTFSRVVPEYIEQNIITFRNKIQAVKVDYETKMVRTVIDSGYFEAKDYWISNKSNYTVDGKLQSYLKKKYGSFDGQPKEKCTLYTITHCVNEYEKDLKKIQNELYAMHIPLNAWMIECDNRLYCVTEKKNNLKNYSTVEAVEPIINYEYCSNVLRGIIQLSGSSLGKTFHTYEKLLRYVREDTANINKIICTVKRLKVLLEYTIKDDEDKESGINIYCDNIGWQIEELIIDGDSQIGKWWNEDEVERIIKCMDEILRKKVGQK